MSETKIELTQRQIKEMSKALVVFNKWLINQLWLENRIEETEKAIEATQNKNYELASEFEARKDELELIKEKFYE